MYYSTKYRAFIDDPASYPNWDLSDLVEISAEEHAALLAAPRIDWSSGSPVAAEEEFTSEQLARAARAQRDALLRNVYDPAVSILQRAIRMGEQGAVAKLAEFDAWAVALQGIPGQEGFPENITWPERPAKEL